MDKFFGNLHLVLIVGLVLAVGLMFAPYYAPASAALGVFQWLHVFFAVVWIGHLYYFNFVQIPTMPKIPAELKPGVSKYIAPQALFFFRWGAAFTVLTGLILAYLYDELTQALTLRPGSSADRYRHVAWVDHGVQRLVHHLAGAKACARVGRSRRRDEGCSGQARDDFFAHQHAAFDPHAALHGSLSLAIIPAPPVRADRGGAGHGAADHSSA